MNVIVTTNFTDKQTGISYNVGAKVEYADNRAKELAEKGFVKLTEKAVTVAKAEKREPKKEDKGTPDQPKKVARKK